MSKGPLIIESEEKEEKWLVHPVPGICVKFRNVQFPSCSIKNDISCNKLFLNIAHCVEIPPPKQFLAEDEVAKLLSTNPSAYQIPISIGNLDKVIDNNGKTGIKVDVLVNSIFFHKCINESEFFKQITLRIINETIMTKYGINIDISGQIILRNKRCMGHLDVQYIRKRPLNSIIDLEKVESINCANLIGIQECEKTIDIDELEDTECRKPRNFKVRLVKGESMEIKVKVKDADGNSVHRLDRIALKMNNDRVVIILDSQHIVADFFLPFQIKDDEVNCQFDATTSSVIINGPVDWK